jgi:beta-glucosidase
LEAGIDLELPARDCYGAPLKAALEAGEIDMAFVDAAVSRMLALKFQLGLFENPYIDEGAVPQVLDSPADRELSRKLAQHSIVLLKNDDGLLPLDPNTKAIAVIGPNADNIRLLQGDYHYPGHLEAMFQAVEIITDAPIPQQNQTSENIMEHFVDSVTLLEGIRAQTAATVHYEKGCDTLSGDTSGFAAAVAAAKQADVVVLAVGDRSGLADGCTVGEFHDRVELGLPGMQQKLVEAIHQTGKPIVLVLFNGRPFTLGWAVENIPAIVEVWLPAQEGGNAIADVLFGKVNPGGKLPMSFPQVVGQVPMHYNHKPSGGRSHPTGKYVDSSTRPMFPFGFGLSYTQFSYSNLHLSSQQVSAKDTLQITVDVQNTGQRAGDEVVQLYLQDVVGSMTRPVKELKGFKRITLQAGEQKTLTFDVPVSHMAFYDRHMNYIVEPGLIKVMVGCSSEDIHLQAEFEIVGKVMGVERSFVTDVRVE